MKIYVTHFRKVEGDEGLPWMYPYAELKRWGAKVSSKGGYTLARIVDEDGITIAFGEAKCSKNDNYNKKIGRLIATGRAKKQLGIKSVG